MDHADDKKKGLERDVSKLEAAIDTSKETITTLAGEIKALGDGIAEATKQCKEENSDFTTLMANDAAAKDILAFAKNRLNKFYNPKFYKEPAASLVQVSMHSSWMLLHHHLRRLVPTRRRASRAVTPRRRSNGRSTAQRWRSGTRCK